MSLAVAYFADLMVAVIICGGLAVAAGFLMVFGGAMCQGCYRPVTGWPWQKQACGWCQMMRHQIADLDKRLKEQGL